MKSWSIWDYAFVLLFFNSPVLLSYSKICTLIEKFVIGASVFFRCPKLSNKSEKVKVGFSGKNWHTQIFCEVLALLILREKMSKIAQKRGFLCLLKILSTNLSLMLNESSFRLCETRGSCEIAFFIQAPWIRLFENVLRIRSLVLHDIRGS